MDIAERLQDLRTRLRASLWFLPTLAVVGASAVALILVRWTVADEGLLSRLVFGGGVAGARSVLQVIAGSTMTVTSVTFSLTIVALVNASNQYSPRVLATFLRDRAQQVVLSIFLATFAYSIIVLRTIPPAETELGVPRLAVTVAVFLSFASLAALVHFIHHITQSIRIESILAGVTNDTLEAIGRLYPDAATMVHTLPERPAAYMVLSATESGYIRAYRPQQILKAAHKHHATVQFRHPTGTHVTAGSALAWAWTHNGSEPDVAAPNPDIAALAEAANKSIDIGKERTLDQDVAFGIRQLADIALRALSPGVNDPTSATDALGRLSVVLAQLTRQTLGPWAVYDDDGAQRVQVPGRDLNAYLQIVAPQVLIYGSQDPTAMCSLVRLLEDVGRCTERTEDRLAIRRYIRACSEFTGQGMEGETARNMVTEAVTSALDTLDRTPTEPPVPRHMDA